LDELKVLQKKIVQTAEVLNSRLFIVLTAQEKGWSFAKQVQFYEAGKKLLSLKRLCLCSMFFVPLGNGENDSYLKVAKQ